MSFVENFTVSQSLGTPSIITFTDTSTGSDVDITSRRIFLLKSDGSYIKDGANNYFFWSYNDASIDLDVFNRDYGLYVTVQWLDNLYNPLYIKNIAIATVAYTKNFINGLTQQETALPNIVGGVNYWDSKAKLQTLVDDADQAIGYGSDYVKAQSFLNQAYYLINNQTRFF